MARKKLSSLTYETRIVARSHPEVFDATMDALNELRKNRKLKFRGRAISLEAYVNVALMALNRMPNDERTKTIELMLARLEAVLLTPAETPAPETSTPSAPLSRQELMATEAIPDGPLGPAQVWIRGRRVESPPVESGRPKKAKRTG